MIRHFVCDTDLDQTVSLLNKFNAVAWGGQAESNSAESLIEGCLEHGTVIVSEDNGVIRGLVAGYVSYNPLLRKYILYETVWYAEDNSGYGLLKAFIAEATELGAEAIHFTVIEPVSDKMQRIMTKRIGFKPIERGYMMNT